MCVATVHRTRITSLGAGWQAKLVLPSLTVTGAFHGAFAVGDWVLVEPATRSLVRRLDRRAVLARHIEWSSVPQLAAANVDTLFIGTSRNADFNPDRMERCLAMANEGGLSR